MTRRDDPQPIGEFLDGLPGRTRKALAEAGFGMERLRELAAGPAGERQVRHIVTEFGVLPDRDGRFILPGDRREVAAGWAVVLLGALTGLTAVLAAAVLVSSLLGLVAGLAAAAGVAALILRTPESRGREAAVLVGLAAVAVLYFTALMNAPQWYLAARGREVAATLAVPAYAWTHGSHVPHCRVRLPDGSVRRVDQDDRTCAARTGERIRVVYDPGGRLAPELGGKAALGRISRPVAGAALAFLVGAGAAAVCTAGRPRKI